MYIIITSLIIFIILSSFLLYDMINIHDIYRSYSVNIINNNSKIQNRIQNIMNHGLPALMKKIFSLSNLMCEPGVPK